MSGNVKPKCYAPKIGIFYNTVLDKISPCCQFKNKYTLSEYDSNEVERLVDLKNPDSPCNICINRESYGKTSLRNSFQNYYNDYYNNEEYPIYADIRTSNFCNFQCNMCTTIDSSKIENYVKKYPHMGKFFKYVSDSPKNSIINLNEKLLKNLKIIKVAGGEPTIDESCYNFLNNLLKINKRKDKELWLTTNGSNLNNFLESYAESFKKISVTISIDAIEDLYEYIRYPGKWNKTEKELQNSITKFHNVSFNINCVIQCFNLIYVSSWIPWFSKFKNLNPSCKIVWLECTSPSHFGLNSLSSKSKSFIIKEIDKLKKYNNINDKLEELLIMIKKSSYNKNDNNMLHNYIEETNKIRKTNAYDQFLNFLKI